MTDVPRSPDGIDQQPPQAFSRKSDANAFDLAPDEIHRQLSNNIDPRLGPVPDKDAVGGIIEDAEASHSAIHREMETLEEDMVSGDPAVRERAEITLNNLKRFTYSKDPTETLDAATDLPDNYPPENTPEGSILNRAFARVMRGFGRRDDPRAELEASRRWNDLRDPGTRDKTIREVLGEEEVK